MQTAQYFRRAGHGRPVASTAHERMENIIAANVFLSGDKPLFERSVFL
jgi:hypothetical protein